MSDFATRQAMLRARTREHHERIETVPALARLLDPDLALSEYAQLLNRLLRFHSALEPRIQRAISPESPARRLLDTHRIHSLQDDLRWLGAVPSGGPVSVPVIATHAESLGALYVLEGSGLGGRVIARSLADHLGVRNGCGASFYDGLTAGMARERWRTLCVALDLSGDEVSDHEMVEAARATFASLEQLLRQTEPAVRQTCLTAAAAD